MGGFCLLGESNRTKSNDEHLDLHVVRQCREGIERPRQRQDGGWGNLEHLGRRLPDNNKNVPREMETVQIKSKWLSKSFTKASSPYSLGQNSMESRSKPVGRATDGPGWQATLKQKHKHILHEGQYIYTRTALSSHLAIPNVMRVSSFPLSSDRARFSTKAQHSQANGMWRGDR